MELWILWYYLRLYTKLAIVALRKRWRDPDQLELDLHRRVTAKESLT